MKKPDVSIAIPVYNEEKGISTTVNNLSRQFKKENYEIILVNHGSVDNTEAVIKKLAKKNKRINAINLPKNLGYGGGIMYGLDKANGKIIGFTCADEEVSAKSIHKIYRAAINTKCDVAKAARVSRQDGVDRAVYSSVFNWLVSTRFGLNVKDVNGYPIFMKRELYKPAKAKEKHHLFNLDFLRNMRKRNYKIIEIPVIHHKRKTGRSFMSPAKIAEMVTHTFRYMFS